MNDMAFHPLAELFPLIEGKEFDDLVASIRENGLRDPITTHEGMILDGRNRYRACHAAAVAPIMHPFTGRDAVRFVIDRNIHRRHLNESQRAMIAARFAGLKHGDVKSQRADIASKSDDVGIPTSKMTTTQAAELMQVHPTTVFDAKIILKEGTEEEIEAVQRGTASVHSISKEIRAKRTPAERKRNREKGLSQSGKNPERIERMRMNAQLWAQLRDSLINLSGLPLPQDVAAIAAGLGKDKRAIVEERLPQALQWLEEFSSVWSHRDEVGAEEEPDRDHHPDAGVGDQPSGAQPPQSAAA